MLFVKKQKITYFHKNYSKIYINNNNKSIKYNKSKIYS